jgi:hypothetical protein
MGAVGERDLGPGERRDAGGTGGLGERHRPVQAVVVGQGERGIAELDGALIASLLYRPLA